MDEFQVGNAETYDVVVRPLGDAAYALVAEAVDRSGMALGTLAPRPGLRAAAPPLRSPLLDTMKDMGMAMTTPSTGPAMSPMTMQEMKGMSAVGSNNASVKLGPGVQSLTAMPQDRTGEPGQGLEAVGHTVLVYQDLVSLTPTAAPPEPTRALEIHLTGNMERYMWGLDGKKFSETTEPYTFSRGERVRVTLINDTMMAHPMHLHGHFFELVYGPADRRPKKHTVIVAPAGKVAWDFTAEGGDWAFHWPPPLSHARGDVPSVQRQAE